LSTKAGYCTALTSLFKKLFSLICMKLLFTGCTFYVYMSFVEFGRYDVVTQIKVKEIDALAFPAVTLCLVDYNYSLDLNRAPIWTEQFSTRALDDLLLKCNYEDRACTVNDFEHFMIYFQYETIESYLNCYKFNGGRNASNQQTEILQSNQFGALSGLILQLYLPKRDFIYYYIGDNKVCNIISWAQLMLKVSEGNMVVEIVY
jgi:hypothetical protein